MKTFKFFLALIALLFVAGCAPKSELPAVNNEKPSFDILGTWQYSLTTPDGNEYDSGTITFSGDPSHGEWVQLNFYDIEYSGTYTVNGDAIVLTGDETWQGQFVDATHLHGQWQNNEASGEWAAVLK